MYSAIFVGKISGATWFLINNDMATLSVKSCNSNEKLKKSEVNHYIGAGLELGMQGKPYSWQGFSFCPREKIIHGNIKCALFWDVERCLEVEYITGNSSYVGCLFKVYENDLVDAQLVVQFSTQALTMMIF
ncbi:hypothetical protein RJ641_010468 [Dillenia turbinata]|uniref:Uncharacterized protein n=1 Tax=Dillenia turbinata TaxID=194707 RepID=A0AAN8VAM8_9MAGN